MIKHFFANRSAGIDKSHENASWRLGQGNVYAPKASENEHPDVTKVESDNALANLGHIISQFVNPSPQTTVMLESQYGKGIHVVDDTFLNDDKHEKDADGRTIVKADGLFCTKDDILLLNKSGDANSLILESPKAIGIIVGSWHCIEKGILPAMLEIFDKHQIKRDEIRLRVGPGIGADAYDLGAGAKEKVVGEHQEYENAFVKKDKKKKDDGQEDKYILNFAELMSIFAKQNGIGVDVSETKPTFDRKDWREAKQHALAEQKPELLLHYYGDRDYFSARLYSRVDKRLRKTMKEDDQTLLDQLQIDKATYAGTGRNLNGVIKRPK